MPFRRLSTCVCLAATAGCYDAVPVQPAPGALPTRDVTVALTDSGAVVLARTIGPASTALVGRLVGDSAGSFVVAVRQVWRRDAEPSTWTGERVVVPHALVASVRERRLSRTRTALTAAATVAGVVLARVAIAGIGGSNAGKNDGSGAGGAK